MPNKTIWIEARIPVLIEPGKEGLIYATSPLIKGLLVALDPRHSTWVRDTRISAAIADMAKVAAEAPPMRGSGSKQGSVFETALAAAHEALKPLADLPITKIEGAEYIGGGLDDRILAAHVKAARAALKLTEPEEQSCPSPPAA